MGWCSQHRLARSPILPSQMRAILLDISDGSSYFISGSSFTGRELLPQSRPIAICWNMFPTEASNTL